MSYSLYREKKGQGFKWAAGQQARLLEREILFAAFRKPVYSLKGKKKLDSRREAFETAFPPSVIPHLYFLFSWVSITI